jgi:hypothetical protein
MNFKFFPSEDYVLRTGLPVTEVLSRISDSIDAKRTNAFVAYFKGFDKPYRGHINGSTFHIVRNISYRNSFLPEIKGTVSTFLGKTEVTIKMALNQLVAIFMILWLSVVGIAAVVIGIGALRSRPTPASLIPVGMFVFGILLTILPFKYESAQSKRFLRELLEGTEEPITPS